MPNLPGDTAMMPPPTPLLAGRPVWYSHFPESSYSPAVDITARTLGTFGGSMTCLPMIGFLPLDASVAAIVARSCAFTPMEH